MLSVGYLNFIYGAVIGGLLTNLLISLITLQHSPPSVWYVFAVLSGAAVLVPLGAHVRELLVHRRRHKER
jgi:hypothetical protein